MSRLIAWAVPEVVLQWYFCHMLPPLVRRWLEKMFFWSDALFERVESVEQDLIHDYVGGRLSPRQRKAFEEHYLITQSRRDRVALAKDLAEISSEYVASVSTRHHRKYFVWVSAGVLITASVVLVLHWPAETFNVPIDSRTTQRTIRNSESPISPTHIPRNVRTVTFNVKPTVPVQGEWTVRAGVDRNPIFNATVALNEQGLLPITIPRDQLTTGLLAIECRSSRSPDNVEEFRVEIDLN